MDIYMYGDHFITGGRMIVEYVVEQFLTIQYVTTCQDHLMVSYFLRRIYV